ncbi:MAG: hypothetical protein Q9M20_08405 [Mariprofundaceae bacterium]|nr:hypothetical protein [Mariprofundaceae bacterium]
MGRIIVVCLLLFMLSACTALTAVGGAAVNGALYMFTAEKKSLPYPMRSILVATQKTLESMELSANLVEPVEDGYILQFANKKLSGGLHLRRETARLTTISGRVYKTVAREKSVEIAIFEGIESRVKKVRRSERFNFKKYRYIREQASVKSAKVGWYIPGTELKVSPTSEMDWLQVKMPSGKKAFLKGYIKK